MKVEMMAGNSIGKWEYLKVGKLVVQLAGK
jgi:hypothetical protein